MTPARNRVSPRGEIIAVPGRGAWMGNRGRLHEGAALVTSCATIGRRPGSPACWNSRGGAPRSGHRRTTPSCSFSTRRSLWPRVTAPAPNAAAATTRLPTGMEQNNGGTMPTPKTWTPCCTASAPANRRSAAVELPARRRIRRYRRGPAVVVGDHLAVWDDDAYPYRLRLPRPTDGSASVLTPASNVAVLGAGYPVQIDRVPCRDEDRQAGTGSRPTDRRNGPVHAVRGPAFEELPRDGATTRDIR